jgi:hypothetical protein
VSNRKKLLPLLAIAFVVAVLATAVFYGLIANRLSQPVAAAGKAEKPPEYPSQTIPSGMRAVSLHVGESSGVIAMVRPGDKVDVLAVQPRSNQPGDVELRTLMQNVEVIAVGPPEQAHYVSGRPVLTVLSTPQEAEALSLADAAGRLRVVLRNRKDTEVGAAPPPAANAPAPVAQRPVSLPAVAQAPIPVRARVLEFDIQVAQIRTDALAQFGQEDRPGELKVNALPPGTDANALWARLEKGRSLETLSRTSLEASTDKEVSLVTDGRWRPVNNLPFDAVGLRLRFVPVTMNNGGVRLKVEPEIKAPAGDTVAVRRIATELTLAQGQSFVVTGLVDAQQLQRLVPVLFPGAVANANARLLVMVTPRQKAPAQIALAR